MEKPLKIILEHMSKHIEGFASSAIVLIADGLSLAKLSIDPDIDSDAVSAYMSGVVNSNLKASTFLDGSHLQDDILITTDKNHFIIRHIQRLGVFFYVMIQKRKQLGKARLYLKSYEKYIVQVLEKND